MSLVSDTKLKHREMSGRQSGHWRAKRTGFFHRTACGEQAQPVSACGRKFMITLLSPKCLASAVLAMTTVATGALAQNPSAPAMTLVVDET
jgi:hypothetical protein